MPSTWLLAKAESKIAGKTIQAYALSLRRFTEYFSHFPPPSFPDTATEGERGVAMAHYFSGFRSMLEAGSPALAWKRMQFKNARVSADNVARFCDWLVQRPGFEDAIHPDPKVTTKLSPFEEMAAFKRRSENEMLFHLYRSTKAGQGLKEARRSSARAPRTSLGDQLTRSQNCGLPDDPDRRIGFRPKAMPLRDYNTLIESEWKRGAWRNVCLFLLLGGGCARTSEALNVYAQDVHYSRKTLEAYVALANPVEGKALDSSGTYVPRDTYLDMRFGLTSRAKLAPNDTLYAGYKGMVLGGVIDADLPEIEYWPERGWVLVEWLFPSYGRMFFASVVKYFAQLREMKLLPAVRHPYLFMNLERRVGDPMTAKGASKQLRLACARAGIAVREPHTLRHTYGSVCADLGIPINETQIRMRHELPSSTLVYYNMSRGKAREICAMADKQKYSERVNRMAVLEAKTPALLPRLIADNAVSNAN